MGGLRGEKMKRFGWILAILTLASPVWAAKHVTVGQLEELVSASRNKPDVDVANQLSDLELTERLSDARFTALKTGLQGEKAQQALLALADQSQFLDPPASEIPSKAAPDFATQRHIMSLVVAYVGKSIPQLPNIYASQQTAFYQESPKSFEGTKFTPYQPLHFLYGSNATARYSNGKDAVEEETVAGKKVTHAEGELKTRGIFGPILTTVLMDAAQNKLAWGRWEQGASGPLAVFNYSVAKEKSHYEVDYCCVADSFGTSKRFHQLAGYHGQISVDPATGSILRLTIEAELKANDPVSRAAMMVDYGPVEIGGKNYICPVKSVSLSRAQTTELLHDVDRPAVIAGSRMTASMAAMEKTESASSVVAGPQRLLLNDSVFSNYHIFRAETRLLAENDTGAGSVPAPAAETSAAPAVSGATAPEATAPPASPAASTAQAAPPPPPTSAANDEIREENANSLLAASANSGPLMASGFTIQSVARLVDVGVVVTDKKGHPIKNLKQGDFEVYDNGRKQEVKFFSQAVSEAASASTDTEVGQSSSAALPLVYSNSGVANAKKDEGSSTILLIDSSNLSFGDLSYARSETMQFLRALPAGERVGLYVLKSHGFQILAEETTDHALLEEKLSRWMPRAQDLQNAQDEELRNRQQFEMVRSTEDLLYVNGNTSNDPEGHAQTLDPALRDWGGNPAGNAMMILVGVARHLAAISGHKDLVWITSDNALVDWSNKAVSIEKGDKNIEPITLHAQEAMNDAHVSVYPLDASQLEGGVIDASVGNRNVQLASQALQSPGGQTSGSLGPEFSSGLDVNTGGHDLRPGRLTAQMQQDMHPIQGPIRHLADATGGRIFRRSGGISNELSGVVDDGHASYQLSFYPEGPADGNFHTITVKLASYQNGAALRYRTGYLYAKEPTTLKQRFQQAVWLPADANQIAVTAQPARQDGSLRVRIKIAASDLALQQKSDRWSDTVDVFLVQRDDAGQQAQVEGKRLGLQLKTSTMQDLLKNGLFVERAVQLKPSITSLRILVVDESSGRMGSVTIPAASLPTGN
jgi:VWFA-related protein